MPGNFDLVIRARRAILPDEGEVARAIGIREGQIAAILPLEASLDAADTWELKDDSVLLPGLVDSHVHVNEPGNTDWEGFATATAAAAAGGITTILDMPLNSIPVTVSLDALEAKRRAATGRCHVDVGFVGGLVPENLDQLAALHEAGVFAFKCFLADSGLSEFPPIDVTTLMQGLGAVRGLGSHLLVHAEIDLSAGTVPPLHSRKFSDYLATRPRGYENLAIAYVIEAARLTGAHAHICHLSSSDALAMIASARRDGVPVTVECCPHYLSLCAEEVQDGATYFKCCPPIREAENRELLWKGLGSNLIDIVVADHSPSPPKLKSIESGDFGTAWGGIASLQLTLPVIWTHARVRGFSLADVAKWMCEGPARLFGLRAKGAIAVGNDADFCIFAPQESFVVDSSKLRHKNPGTPYDGRELQGVVRSTVLRGERVDIDTPHPHGRLLRRVSA